MLKDNKYKSLNSAVAEIVSKGEDLRAKQLQEQYNDNDSEELYENIIAKGRLLFNRLRHKDLITRWKAYHAAQTENEWGVDYWCNIGKFAGPYGKGHTAKSEGQDPDLMKEECQQWRSNKARVAKELEKLEKELESKFGKDWKEKIGKASTIGAGFR